MVLENLGSDGKESDEEMEYDEKIEIQIKEEGYYNKKAQQKSIYK